MVQVARRRLVSALFIGAAAVTAHAVSVPSAQALAAAAAQHNTTTQPQGAVSTDGAKHNEVVSKVVADALNGHSKPIKGSKITLLGMAYKKDVDDPRESPGFELMELLLEKGAVVLSGTGQELLADAYVQKAFLGR